MPVLAPPDVFPTKFSHGDLSKKRKQVFLDSPFLWFYFVESLKKDKRQSEGGTLTFIYGVFYSLLPKNQGLKLTLTLQITLKIPKSF